MTATDSQYGDLLRRALIRINSEGKEMQTLLMSHSGDKAAHRQDGFTGLSLGHRPDSFVVTGVVGADNVTTSYPDSMMFLPTGGRPCFTEVRFNATQLYVLADITLDNLA